MLFFVFFFKQLKKNHVCKPSTGHFRGLVDFETKAKDGSFETMAKTKDLKMWPFFQGRSRGHPLWI